MGEARFTRIMLATACYAVATSSVLATRTVAPMSVVPPRPLFLTCHERCVSTSDLLAGIVVGLLTNVAYAGTTNTSGLKFAYDALNRVTNAVDGWATNVFVYDVLGRVVQAREIQGTFTQTFSYAFDAIGRTTNVTWQAGTNAAVSTVYGYDTLNRITNVTSDAGTFGYEYVSNGLAVKTLTYPNGDMADYVYDGLRRLTNLSFRLQFIWTPTGQWGYQYNARDQVVRRTDPATNLFAYGYDEAARLKEATAGTSVTGYPCRYTYDWAGNRARQTEATRTRRLVANANNQLVSIGRSNEASIVGYVNEAGTCTVVQVKSSSMTNWLRVPTRYVSYTQAFFEAYGVIVTNAGTNNTIWIKATDKAGNTSTQTVHVSNSSTNRIFGYDADGNQTNGLAGKYAWDADNRLISVTYPDNSQTRFRYDGVGRMREVAEFSPTGVATNTLRYTWSGWQPIAELDGSNRIVRTFTWGLDVSCSVGGAGGIGGLVGIRHGGTNYNVRTDGKGNVTEVRTSAGTVVAAYTYAPFGGMLTSSGTYAQPFQWQTKMWHAKSGLGYWGLRWYDPVTGKWISRDGLGEAGGLNLYEYCGGDPIGFCDPYGLTGDSYLMGVSQTVAGYLDGLLFGVLPNQDNANYRAGQNVGDVVSLAGGLARLGYAGAAKVTSLALREAPTMVNAVKAVATRNALKKAFRLNPWSEFRIYTFENRYAYYGGDLSKIIRGAGRTNKYLNLLGAGAAARSLYGLFGPDAFDLYGDNCK